MKKTPTLLLVAIVLSLFSCNSNKPDLRETVDGFADLECRAMALKDSRFDLANELRFTQDTLLQTSNKADTSRLKLKLETLNKEKEKILKASLSLADSIRNELTDLMKNDLKEEKDKAAFNRMLDSTLLKRGCMEKS